MKNLKKLFLFMLCLVLTMSVSLTACGDDEEDTPPAHTHSWGEWQVVTNATCTTKGLEQRSCSGCSERETRDIATTAHSGTFACEICQADLIIFEEIDLSSYESIGIKLTDVEAVITDEGVNAGTITMDIAEFYAGLDADGELTGYGYATLKGTYANIANLKTNMDVIIFAEDGALYLSALGTSPFSDDMYSDYNLYFVVELDKVPDLAEAEQSLAQVQQMIDTYLPTIEEYIEETLAPIFANVDIEDAIDAITTTTNKYSIMILNSLFTATKNADGTTTVALDLDAVKDWYAAILTNSIADLIDIVLGDGAVESIEAALTDKKLYNYSVAQLIAYVENEQGVDLVELLAALDELAVIISGNEEATFEYLIAMVGAMTDMPIELPEDFDLDAYLEDEAFLALAVKDAISMMLGMTDDPATEDDEVYAAMTAMLTTVFDTIKENTIYDLISSAGGEGGEMVSPLSLSEDEIDAMIEGFGTMLDMVSEMFALELTVNQSAKVTALKFNLALEDIPVDETVLSFGTSMVITAEKIAADFALEIADIGMEQAYSLEIIPNYTVQKNTAKIAEIKEKLSVADDVLTYDIIKAERENAGNYRVYNDPTNERIFVVYFSLETYTDSDGDYYVGEASLEITEIKYADLNGYMRSVTYGHENYVSLSYSLPGSHDHLSIDLDLSSPDVYNTDYEAKVAFMDSFGLNEILESFEPYDTSNTYVDFVYNTVTGTYEFYTQIWDEDTFKHIGHTFVKQNTSTSGNECMAIYHSDYKCSCGATYTSYYQLDHDLTVSTSVSDDGTASFTYRCKKCDEFDACVGSAVLNANASVTLDTTPDPNMPNMYTDTPASFAFSYTPEKLTTLYFSFSDDSGHIDRLVITGYRRSPDGSYEHSNHTNVYGDGEYHAYVSAGYEYYFVVSIELESSVKSIVESGNLIDANLYLRI